MFKKKPKGFRCSTFLLVIVFATTVAVIGAAPVAQDALVLAENQVIATQTDPTQTTTVYDTFIDTVMPAMLARVTWP